MTATPPCTARRYRTARYAKRQAWSQEPDASRRPVPVQCEACNGAWHLADPETEPTTNDGRS